MPERVALTVRRALLFIAGSEALYLFAAFCAESVLEMDPLMWHREAIDLLTSLFVVPWGPALCLLALERRTRMERSGIRADLAVLFGLLVWIVVPFALWLENASAGALSTVVFTSRGPSVSHVPPRSVSVQNGWAGGSNSKRKVLVIQSTDSAQE